MASKPVRIPAPSEVDRLLKAAPLIQAANPADTQMGSPIPPRKAWTAVVGGLVTLLIVHLLRTYAAFDVPVDIQTMMSMAVAGAVAWIVPPAKRDTIQHLTDEIVQEAMRDPQSNVSYLQIPVQPPPGEPAVIVPPATKV